MPALKKLKPGAKSASSLRQRVLSTSFRAKTRVAPARGAGDTGHELAIRVDASEIQVIRPGHLPDWFRESLQKDIERLETVEREQGAGYKGY
jgi:hypothetical protein